MKRRDFIQTTLALSGLAALTPSCTQTKKIGGRIIGASANVGHLLRNKSFDQPSSFFQKDIVIVGAGVSGLSAAYHLQKAGITDFFVLDLEEKAGGNAACGSNSTSAYPWGAHYVPVPNNSLTDYLRFLEECKVITGYNENGLPVYNELFLCFDPEERLYINGQWQEGLVPQFGVPTEERKQIERFLALMNDYRYKKGGDGKEAFALPVDASSNDHDFLQLDRLTMKDWLQQNGFTSAYLHSYVNYCNRDDFGTNHDAVSAWAGVHYFACRKGKGANATHHDVLTWPEGNGWLVAQLQKNIQPQLKTGCLVTRVAVKGEGVVIHYLDINAKKLIGIEAKHCIMAVPQFVAARLLRDESRLQTVQQHLHYVPWMVANITVNKLEERSGPPLSWDNVIHNSPSLGYVEATHQLVTQHRPKRNLTYYLPLTDGTVAEARKAAQRKTHEEWVKEIIDDLKRIHPNMQEATEEINVQLWGHAMAQPLPGLIKGKVRQSLAASIDYRIHFAHTDLAGVSLFEEAFYQGLAAAKKATQNLSA